MMTGPCVSRCESVTALPRAFGRVKSGACAPSLRAFSAAPEFMSCPIGRSKSCSRFVGNQLAPSAINSSICCCNGVFVLIFVAMIFLLVLQIGTTIRSLVQRERVEEADFLQGHACHKSGPSN